MSTCVNQGGLASYTSCVNPRTSSITPSALLIHTPRPRPFIGKVMTVKLWIARKDWLQGSVFARSGQVATYCRWKDVRIAIVTISKEFMEHAPPFTKCPIELRPAQGARPSTSEGVHQVFVHIETASAASVWPA